MTLFSRLAQSIMHFLTSTSGAARATVAAGWLALCVSAVGAFEGLRTVAYMDPVGIPTICFGETDGVRLGQTKTRAECEAMLAARVQEFDRGMQACVQGYAQLPPPTRAAVTSFAYNVGLGAACKSTLAAHLRRGNIEAACNELPKWVNATKAGVRVRLPGLVTRRAEERRMCLQGTEK